MQHSDFWKGQRGLDNIKPKRVGKKWESYDAIALVSELVGDDSVVEVGCGQGRFSRGFTPEQYIGVDLNPAAIDIAQQGNTDYEFKIVKEYSEIPSRDVMLLHSAALHVPDDEIFELFAQANKRIILAETMGVRIARETPKPAKLAFHYARTEQDYIKILKDWKLENSFTKHDTNSGKTFTYMVFNK